LTIRQRQSGRFGVEKAVTCTFTPSRALEAHAP